MGELIPEPHEPLYQEWQSHKIVCWEHAKGKAVMHIPGKLTGAERCYYCQRQPEIKPA